MSEKWMTCDGSGGLCENESWTTSLSRRNLFRGALSLAGTGLIGSAISQAVFRNPEVRSAEHTLVVVFLRGGADCLNIVAPYQEDHYYKGRPSIAISRPNDRSSSRADRLLDLDGFFGFHPSMAPLLSLFKDGKLGIVHATGSADTSHSHFQAMSVMERGEEAGAGGQATGWLARYLNQDDSKNHPLRAVAFDSLLPDSLRGSVSALALTSIEDFKFVGDANFRKAIESMYKVPTDEVMESGHQVLQTLTTLEKLTEDKPAVKNSNYPASNFGDGLQQAAMLIKAEVGLEVACVDLNGWDTHVTQGGSTGWQAGMISELATGLSNFWRDLGDKQRNVTVVVMTEFGRRVYENSGLGTDHGAAGMMFALGEGVSGGKVHGSWPGIGPGQIVEPGDLKVTTDYREVLSEVLVKRMGCTDATRVFGKGVGASVGLIA